LYVHRLTSGDAHRHNSRLKGIGVEQQEIQKIREGFPALRNYTWFQNGGVSLTSLPVHAEYIRLLQEIHERGPMHIVYPDEEFPRRRQTIERLARFFSVEAGELALMRGVSEAFQTVLRGLTWQRGDQIIVTANEESALLLPVLQLRDRYGVEVVQVPLVAAADEQVEAVIRAFTGRAKLVALSHVVTDFGHRLPVRPICDAARQRGILTFLDLAQSAGLFPLPIRELGCDFAGVLSYKWMYGPYAAGFLFVRRERLDDLQVTYAGGRSQQWLNFETDQYALHESAERFQYGPWAWPLVHAWAKAADYLADIGLDAIWQRTVVLATRLKRGLKEIPGCTLWTPESPTSSAALVTFSVAGFAGAGLSAALRERWAIVIKPVKRGAMDGLRASVPFFLLESEVDTLLTAIRTLVSERMVS
jgi:cysteine desulfurase / selenocysteine lyase